ncbi:Testis-expressed protein 9 [Eumeta japonica]|uniref:Testis-expressed protein 9 n=1 Tax=Eumeta variegata TaxID=151549 RepID=A0A4C1Y5I3_EUMVA|nr:Testis-expressed protein 9 [Eumeta japonica]
MDSVELLAREEEFRKLNKQLELKTTRLMKEVEDVMQKPDFFVDFASSSLYSPARNQKPVHTRHCNDITDRDNTKNVMNNETPNAKPQSSIKPLKNNNNKNNNRGRNKLEVNQMQKDCQCCTHKRNQFMGSVEFLQAFIYVNVQDKVLPQAFLKESPGVEGVCKFLASKVKLMQEQMDRLQSVINEKTVQCQRHLTHCAELEGGHLQLVSKARNCEAEVTELRAKCNSLQNKLAEKQREHKEQKTEADRLTAEVKKLKSKLTQAEAKCTHHDDEAARLKQQIEVLKNTEKEFRAASRDHSASQMSAISSLETRNKNLTTAMMKLNELIDNLKKQNAILSANVMIEGLEKEYSKLLLEGQ